jgi:anti-anti-sigma factor
MRGTLGATAEVQQQAPPRNEGELAVTPNFSLDCHHEPDHWVVSVCGELDLAVAATLAESVHSLSGTVVVDCSNLTFVDSTGIAVLIATHQRLEKSGGHLRIVGLTSTTRRPFAISGLDTLLDLGGRANSSR